MTKGNLTLVWEKADDPKFEIPAYPDNNTECVGIAYWTEKRPVTLVGAVSLVRWQAANLLGGWNSEMLQETLIFLQKNAILLSSLSPSGEKTADVEKMIKQERSHYSNDGLF